MNQEIRVLVVDDEVDIRESMKEILEEEGFTVTTASTISAALRHFAQGVDLAIVDIKLGSENGLDLLGQCRAQFPQVPVIIISGHGTVSLTAEAFKLGAHDFMEKPLRLIQVRTSVRNALEAVRLRHRVAEHERDKAPRAVYRSDCMKTLYSQVRRLGAISEPVVIMGPSGSGKELVARSLHFDSPRGNGPFIATNAASLPVNLAEDELFGHEKGAFTGAHARRAGCLEQADGGTLFLDEIGDMDPQVQAKLLRVLETGQFARLGGTRPITVQVRIVTATHKDLQALVSEGNFRHDLWYRLCAFVVRIPPLSERKDDIPLLAETFLAGICNEMGIIRSFTPEALEVLSEQPYPGNVRQLKHTVTRAAVFSDRGEIDQNIIEFVSTGMEPSATETPATDSMDSYFLRDFRSARDKFEYDYLRTALDRHDGNITATAASIGMAQSNLSRKLKDVGLR